MTRAEYFRRYREKNKAAYQEFMKTYSLNVADLEGELWRPIAGYDEFYHVSNFGRVKSFHKGTIKILKPCFNFNSLSVKLCKNRTQKDFLMNRLVAFAFLPNPDNKPEVDHLDGNMFNNRVENLKWVTTSENQRHGVNIGLMPQGEDYPRAVVTNDDAVYIRNNPDNLMVKELAEKFGVDTATIIKIQRGVTYKNAGGSFREPLVERVPDEIRAAIRAEYVKGKYRCGSVALAKKYGVCQRTVLNIVNEKS